jgi:glucosylglycerate phosphorylase
MHNFLPYLIDLYRPETAPGVNTRLETLLASYHPLAAPNTRLLDQRDALIITYGDQFRRDGEPPLRTLNTFAGKYLGGVASGLHILPFYPYTSDDGFSVVDYRAVDPALGSWEDVAGLQQNFLLMYDAVINHVSVSSAWFQGFLRGQPPYTDYFITTPPETDLTGVVRPRALPLLTPFETKRGRQQVWTTFSADQVDLNYRSPDLLLEVFAALLDYTARGARLLRLDAIAYLWKEIGTSCIHLPQTHRFIQLLRAVLDQVAPHVLLVSETNVPHRDNISYFGDGSNEAQMVYNFALPPLVLHAFASASAAVLSEWAAGLQRPSDRATFFNFLASHDGLGLNPARGILPDNQIEALLRRGEEHGGRISLKTNPDGSQSAYELNINYFDALSDPASSEPLDLQARRFLAAQAILLSLAGLPGIYIHSLLGSRSWQAGVTQTGMNRTINRQKFSFDELDRELDQPGLRRAVYQGYARLLKARAQCAAFHPYGHQQVLDAGESIFALLRSSPEGESAALCLINVSGEAQDGQINSPVNLPSGHWQDLLTGQKMDLTATARMRLDPYQVAWLVP